jgi:DNA polymerase III alpha subunit (gram-positive type)
MGDQGYPSNFASVIVVDVETTGLNAIDNEILQIAASSANGDNAEMFSIFINPVQDKIDPFITNLTGISKHNGSLFAKEAPVASEPLASAVKKFLSYLEKQPLPVMLVAHNAAFDAKFILRAFAKCDLLDRFLTIIAGFSCSLAAARQQYPKVQFAGLENHKLKTLHAYFVKSEDIEFHSANQDVLALKRILPFLMKSKAEIARFALAKSSLGKFYQ